MIKKFLQQNINRNFVVNVFKYFNGIALEALKIGTSLLKKQNIYIMSFKIESNECITHFSIDSDISVHKYATSKNI